MHPLKSSSNFWTIENGKRGGTEQNRKYNLWGHNHSNKVFKKSLHSIYCLLSLLTASFHKKTIWYWISRFFDQYCFVAFVKKPRETWYILWIGFSWKYIVNVKVNWNAFKFEWLSVNIWTLPIKTSSKTIRMEWGVSSVSTLYHSFGPKSGLRYNWSVKRIFCASLSFLPSSVYFQESLCTVHCFCLLQIFSN